MILHAHRQNQDGFTVIEVLVALSITTAILLGIGRFLSQSTAFNRIFSTQIRQRTDARRVIETMVDEMRLISPSETGTYPIVSAQDNQLQFYADYDNDGVAERVTYALVGSTLQRSTLEPTGMPFIYDDLNEVTKTIASNIISTSPIFSYFDGSFQGGAPVPPPAAPDSIDLRLWTDTSNGNEEARVDDVEIICDLVTTFSESFGSSSSSVVSGWTESESNSWDAQISTSASLGGSPTTGHLRLEQDASVTKNINTLGCTDVTLKYYWRGDNDAESSEYLYIEWRAVGAPTWIAVATYQVDPPGCTSGSCPWSSQESRDLVGGAGSGTVTSDIRYIQIRIEIDEDINRAPQPVVIESGVTLRNLKNNF